MDRIDEARQAGRISQDEYIRLKLEAARGEDNMRKRVSKDVTGDFSTVAEYDITELGHEPRGADTGVDRLGRSYSDEASTRLGDLRVMNVVRQNLPEVRSVEPGEDVPETDNWHGSVDAGYIGGREVGYRPALVESMRGTAGGYQYRDPNTDKRGPENFADGADSPIAGPANAHFPGASTRTRKRRVSKRGILADVLLGPDAGASRHTNFFDDPQPEVKKSSGSIWSDVFCRGSE